jgi:hypothetical protein
MSDDTTSEHPLLASFSGDGGEDCERSVQEKRHSHISDIKFLLPLCRPSILIVSWCTCLASVTVNFFLVYLQYRSFNIRNDSISTAPQSSFMGQSAYTGLSLDTPAVHYHHTDYWSKNSTKADELWESIDTNPMVVALTDDFADAHNLPRSDRFPWDDNKGRYFVKVFHQLHCLVSEELL